MRRGMRVSDFGLSAWGFSACSLAMSRAPAHQLQRRFDPSPSIGLFAFALHFEAASFLSCFDKGFVTMCF
jgi:hypothetical protein